MKDNLCNLINSDHGTLRLPLQAHGQRREPERPTLQRKPTWRSWTDEQKAEVRRMSEDGVPVAEIAEHFGRTKKAIGHILYSKPIVLTGTRGRRLTERQLSWFIRHYKNTRNEDIQRKLNITFSTLHRLAREHGLKKTRQYMRQSQRVAAQAAYESHLLHGTFPPKGYRIPGGENARFQPGVTPEQRLGKRRNAERIRKAAESLRRTREKERRRVIFGMEQQTRLRIVKMSRSKLSYRYNLRKDGYIESPDDRNVWFYPNEQMRHPPREANGIRHGITFYPLPTT